MKALFYDILVVRDANFQIPRLASAWELPILIEIYGEGNVVISGEVQREVGDVDIASEKARLERLYKTEEDSKIPFVEVVYGRGPSCLKALEKAVKQAEVEEKRGPGRPPKDKDAD
jgi:hypothetical protein